MSHDLPEFWLRGPVPGVPPLLQSVAHALLQAREEAARAVEDLPDALLWTRPAGVASVGFHLQHMRGVVDRLFTYARSEKLTPAQLRELSGEGERPDPDPGISGLLDGLGQQVDRALDQLRSTDERSLGDARGVGRAQLPSTVIGLLVHAAEHTQRHLGQLLVTARVQREAIHGGDPSGRGEEIHE